MDKAKVEAGDLIGAVKSLNYLPKQAQNELRSAAQDIAGTEAEQIRSAAESSSRQAAAIATFIKARRDRLPAISAGGSRRTGLASRATAGQIFWGAEFGGRGRPTTMQFRPHTGRVGYFFFPTLRNDEQRMLTRWVSAAEAVERKWANGEQ